jgi:hypothetical protein
VQKHPRALSAQLRSRSGFILRALIIIVIAFAVSTAVSRTALFGSATAAQPQPFTELYFADPDALPKTVQFERDYSIGFVIANRTDATRKYTYDVTVQTESAIVRHDPVTVTVAAHDMTLQYVTFQTPVPTQTTTVAISLEGTDQVIRFYAAP